MHLTTFYSMSFPLLETTHACLKLNDNDNDNDNMKVSVCFGATRILVPCGNGDLLVKDLITDAIRRFKKASGKVLLILHLFFLIFDTLLSNESAYKMIFYSKD